MSDDKRKLDGLEQVGEFDQQPISVDVLEIELGPSHPAMHGVVKLNIKVDGETLLDVVPEVGYLHRGFEKTCENRKWTQCIPYVDRLNYVSAPVNDIAFCMTVEQMFGLEIPARATALRTILMEVGRITDHLTCIGASAMELGGFTGFLWLMQAREYWYFFLDHYCGARITTNLSRIGGMPYDVFDGFENEVRTCIRHTRKLLFESHLLLTKNRIFHDRLRNVGVVSTEEAIDLGLTGPCLRSTGLEHDLRKARPYLLYDELDFDIPVGVQGDNYDRYIVRMEELRQSCLIIEQLLPNIPEGPLMVDDPHIALVPKTSTYNHIEGIIYHFKLLTEGHKVPAGDHYFGVEAPNGELGFYLVSDGSGLPYRMRARPPSMYHTAALPYLLHGHMIADIIPTFGSINMIGGELER